MADKLTKSQKLAAAYFHLVRGIAQQDLAALYNVNQGRISEAVRAVEDALDDKK